MDQLRATHTFDITHVTPDPHDARERDHRRARRASASSSRPTSTTRARAATGAKILVLIDGSRLERQRAGARRGQRRRRRREPRGAERDASGRRAPRRTPALAVQPIILFNPDGRTANYIIPGLVAILLQIVAIVLTAVSIVREREQGTLEQLLVTPIDPLGLMLGKLAPYLFVGIWSRWR